MGHPPKRPPIPDVRRHPRAMNRSESGFILPMTLVTITLLAFAALLTGRTFGIQLQAAQRERLIIEERLTSRNIDLIVDEWMAEPATSKDITEGGDGSNGQRDSSGNPVWRTPDGSVGCSPPADPVCWTFTTTDPTPINPSLRGGEAERDIRDITIEIRSGCLSGIDRCLLTSETTRSYERSVFAQYQLHYRSHVAPPGAMAAVEQALRDAQQALLAVNPSADVDTDPSLSDERLLVATLDSDTDGTVDTDVVFADGDIFNGPVRFSGSGLLKYCLQGTDTLWFRRLETRTANNDQNLCDPVQQPNWCDDPCNSPLPEPWTPNSRRVVRNDDPRLPTWEVPNTGDRTDLTCDPCGTFDFDDPDEDVFYSANDINLSTVDFPISGRSISIISAGAIHVTGNVKTTGFNATGGPHVIALIAQDDIILDHAPGTPITLSGVALLAHNGGVFAHNWYQTCGGNCPHFSLEGSAAMHHLGLYGQIGPPQTGWEKDFTYPPDFWRARPPWWPDFTGNEWEPA